MGGSSNLSLRSNEFATAAHRTQEKNILLTGLLTSFSTFLLVLYQFIINGRGQPRWLVVKNLPAGAGDMGSIPGMGRSPGVGNGN